MKANVFVEDLLLNRSSEPNVDMVADLCSFLSFVGDDAISTPISKSFEESKRKEPEI